MAIQFLMGNFPFFAGKSLIKSSSSIKFSSQSSYYAKNEERNSQLFDNLLNRNTKFNNQIYPKNPF